MAGGRDGRRRSSDWSFPGLACTLLLTGQRVVQLGGPVAISRLGGRFVDALLHPLHDQVQQRDHRLVHLRSRRRARLKVRDSAAHKKKKNIPLKAP